MSQRATWTVAFIPLSSATGPRQRTSRTWTAGPRTVVAALISYASRAVPSRLLMNPDDVLRTSGKQHRTYASLTSRGQ